MNARGNTKIIYVGGPDISLRLEMLRLLKHEGYVVCVAGTNEKEKSIFEREGISFLRYNMERSRLVLKYLRGIIQLHRIFTKEEPHIIHAFDTIPSILGRIAAITARVPIIIGTIPGMGALFSEDGLVNSMLRILYLAGQKIACGNSTMTIFQNIEDLSYFRRKKLVSASKARIIKGSGIDVKRFSLLNLQTGRLEEVKEELQLDTEMTNIFMISRIVRHKGVNEYLEAAKLLKSKHPNVMFYLVGPVDKTVGSFPLQNMRKYSGCVRYLGFREEIPEILYFADIVILPSYYREGIPRVLLEAACIGRAIVTTSMPGCRDIVEDGINGYLVPPRDTEALVEATERLILDTDLRERMGEYSKMKVINEFSLDIVFKQTLEVYDDLLRTVSSGVDSL